MQPSRHGGLTFINADTGGGRLSSLRIEGSWIAAMDCEPQDGDAVVDLGGDRILPGLINAHDHLQLNGLPCLDSNKSYRHAREWIADINTRRQMDRTFEARVAVSREDRLLIGGMKNLLSGVTTVAHHDPLYPYFLNAAFPTRVVMDCGWSHSLYIDGEEQVLNAYRRTPAEWPWIIHAAEGLDEEAANEFVRLNALGCIGPNSLIVHGVALDDAQRMQLCRAGAGLVWCPSSNLRLFGRTAAVADLIAQGRVALGTDSRLSGARDLLDELRIAEQVGGLEDHILESLVTSASARLLRLPDRGVLKAGARADLLVLPAHMRLSTAARVDIRLVLIDGRVRYGDKDYAQAVAPGSQWAQVRVDGRSKVLDSRLAAILRDASEIEAGLDLPELTWRAA